MTEKNKKQTDENQFFSLLKIKILIKILLYEKKFRKWRNFTIKYQNN